MHGATIKTLKLCLTLLYLVLIIVCSTTGMTHLKVKMLIVNFNASNTQRHPVLCSLYQQCTTLLATSDKLKSTDGQSRPI